jgi:hypothetical protein
VVYAPRAPIFADDDLALVQLLANQIGGARKSSAERGGTIRCGGSLRRPSLFHA